MVTDSIFLSGVMTRVTTLNTLVVGGGIAGLACALDLYDLGLRDIALLTDSPRGSVSCFAKSDNQQYFRLADFGSEGDSPFRMARDLASLSGMDGPLAYAESSHSLRAFYRLTQSGVPFKKNLKGEFVDESQPKNARRQISAGPDTSGKIYEALLSQVSERGITIFPSYQLARLIPDENGERAVGAVALNLDGMNDRQKRFVLFNCTNVVLATGCEGGLYRQEAIPQAHAGALGAAFRAGARGLHLTETVTGICALRRCLTMNGAYQEALPRYISVDGTGRNPKEFLSEAFDSPETLEKLQRKKGQEWAFDVKRARADGSSLIDLLIHQEIQKGRHVFMDFRANPSFLSADDLPWERLKELSSEAYQMLLSTGIDPAKQAVEVGIQVRSFLGGLYVDEHFESNLKHLFPIGEAAGRLGVYAPDGASMASTQVSASIASEYIVQNYQIPPLSIDQFQNLVKQPVTELHKASEMFLSSLDKTSSEDQLIRIRLLRAELGRRMDQAALLIRDTSKMLETIDLAKHTLELLPNVTRPEARQDLAIYFQIEDLLLSQIVFLSAMLSYKEKGGKSRGSFLIPDPKGILPSGSLSEEYRFSLADAQVSGLIQETSLDPATLSCQSEWKTKRSVSMT